MSERLTKRLPNGGVMYDNGEYWAVCYPWNEHCLRDIDRMAIKLCDLEDKIEQGDVVEVRHGEWIGLEYDGYADGCPVYDKWECSECHEEYNSDGEPPMFNYCPECGAKMDGERRTKDAT